MATHLRPKIIILWCLGKLWYFWSLPQPHPQPPNFCLSPVCVSFVLVMYIHEETERKMVTWLLTPYSGSKETGARNKRDNRRYGGFPLLVWRYGPYRPILPLLTTIVAGEKIQTWGLWRVNKSRQTMEGSRNLEQQQAWGCILCFPMALPQSWAAVKEKSRHLSCRKNQGESLDSNIHHWRVRRES